MSDATTNVAADAATMHIPVVILYASVPALVTMSFVWLAVALEASKGVLIVTMVMAIVGGCGVLTALVIHSGRKTARRTEAVLLDAMNDRQDRFETDLLNILKGVAQSNELALKNGKATRSISTSLADCRERIIREVETNRVAYYAVAAENSATGTSGQRGNLHSVDS